MEVFPKFIVEDGNIIISKCTFHHQLVTNPDKVQGGGMFRYEDGVFTLYGKSHDYGPAKLGDIQKAISEKKVFSNSRLKRELTSKYKFQYDTGSKIIDL
jgi:hypothetical protein